MSALLGRGALCLSAGRPCWFERYTQDGGGAGASFRAGVQRSGRDHQATSRGGRQCRQNVLLDRVWAMWPTVVDGHDAEQPIVAVDQWNRPDGAHTGTEHDIASRPAVKDVAGGDVVDLDRTVLRQGQAAGRALVIDYVEEIQKL